MPTSARWRRRARWSIVRGAPHRPLGRASGASGRRSSRPSPGFCLGGGYELALACDLIVASETAQFGQPETGLGIIPGAGGTQRLTRAVGKAKAMDVILSGRFLTARGGRARRPRRARRRQGGLARGGEARRPGDRAKGPVAQRLAKESVNRAHETTLETGLDYERKALYLAFASEDAREGLTAFTEKRKPDFKGR